MKKTLATSPDLFRAFADPTRLRLLNLLIEGEVCVCDLCDVLEEIQPKVSRHLAYLRRAGLVTARQEGKWKYYRAIATGSKLERSLLECVRNCLRGTDVLTCDLKRLKKRKGKNCCL